VHADAHDRLVLLAATSTLDCVEWWKDPGLESGFDPMLDQIWYLVENGLTSLMVLHDFMSKRLAPLLDRPHPKWMYTAVNDIMWLDHGPGSSLGEDLLATCLKALTLDQLSAELLAPPAACEPICMNQATRTMLFSVMPTQDTIDITSVQRGDLSHGVPIPRTDISSGLDGATGGHGGTIIGGQGGSLAGGGPACRWGTTGGSSPALAPSKGMEK
jgi:hypothetical protein